MTPQKDETDDKGHGLRIVLLKNTALSHWTSGRNNFLEPDISPLWVDIGVYLEFAIIGV